MTIRSGDALGQFLKKKKMANSTDSRTGRLRYIYSTLGIYLAADSEFVLIVHYFI